MHLIDIEPGELGHALVLHGGAGGRVEELTPQERQACESALASAHAAGIAVLAAGGSALDAVCRTVEVLEDSSHFNAGHGAALTAAGHAELDASVMTGDGRAGAVAVTRHARNPVLAARSVMEETGHVLLVAPSAATLAGWGVETVEPEYFVTAARMHQLQQVRSRLLEPSRHGTVGAVALDATGGLAAATSTGGMVNQSEGRVGDTPVIGAGTYARDGLVAISCTGVGEAFMQGVVAHEIASRMRYAGHGLAAAVTGTITDELEHRGADGGVIAVAADGRIVVAHNSTAMFAAFESDGRLVTLT